MNRMIRVTIGFLAPGLLAAILWMVIFSIFDGQFLFSSIANYKAIFLIFIIIFSYTFLPSIIGTIFMERKFKQGLSPKDWKTVGWAALCGTFAALWITAEITATLCFSSSGDLKSLFEILLVYLIILIPLGSLVGMLIGLATKTLHRI